MKRSQHFFYNKILERKHLSEWFQRLQHIFTWNGSRKVNSGGAINKHIVNKSYSTLKACFHLYRESFDIDMKQTMNLGIEDSSTEAYTTGLSWKNLSQTSEGNFIENFYLLCIKTGVCLFMYTHFIYPENCSTLKMFN